MTRVKILCPALLTAFALATAFSATQASAEVVLPDEHTLSDEGYPVAGAGTLENGGAIVAELETIIGEKLSATAMKVEVTLEKLSALGPATLTFKGVTEPRTKTICLTNNTTVEGEVKIVGEYHVVTNAVLTQQSVLILFNEAILECNSKKLKIRIKAPALTKLEKVTAGTDLEKYGLTANCTPKGKQELIEYLNDEGKTVANAFLLANFGLGLEKACLRLSKELTVSSSAMIDFLF